MEAETSLVGADSGVELNPVAEVGLNLTLVVNPGYPECEDTVGLDDSLDDLSLLELGMLVVNLFDGLEYFADCLQVLFLVTTSRTACRYSFSLPYLASSLAMISETFILKVFLVFIKMVQLFFIHYFTSHVDPLCSSSSMLWMVDLALTSSSWSRTLSS